MREIKLGEKLLPLVQLLPAAAVAGAVLVTLPHTAPVLAAVPERLSITEEQPTSEPASAEPTEELLTVKLPYEDGIYTGSSRGYGGQVKVQVTMENGTITDVQILSAAHETAAFLKRAKRLVNTVLTEQTWEVDAVSEATYTSRGILGAIQNALTGEEVINPAPPQPKPAEPLVVEEFVTPSAYRDGVYTASAEGFGGPITVQVTLSGDVITDITILSHDGETSSYFSRARYVISAILESQNPDVDAISGATYSSTGILNAVKLALSKAATDTALPEEPSAEAAEAPSEEAAASEPEASSETPAVMTPSVEVVHAEEPSTSLLQRAKKLWKAVFSEDAPESEAASTAASSAESEAPAVSEPLPDAAASETPEAADTTPAPEQPEETEGQPE